MKQNYASLFSFLKKSIVICAVGATTLANAQVATSYVFSQSPGTFTPITGGTVVAAVGSGWDDASFTAQPIGFTFVYDGTSYTTFGVNCNGFIVMGSGPVVNTYCGAQGVTATNNHDMIAGYGTDMIPISPASGEIRYETIGISPFQQLVVQWVNCHHYPGGPTGDDYSFQIILNETTNTVQVVFGTFLSATTMGANTCSDAANEAGSVGLVGTSPADFNLRAITNGIDTWSASVAATLLSGVCNLSPANVPASGLTFSWVLPPTDMGATTLVTPVVNSCYSANETVTVRIQNFGSQTIDFSVDADTVNCSVTGPNPQVFPPVVLSSGTLAPSATQDVVITNAYDMSLIGTYTFNASTSTANDANPANDNMTTVIIPYGIVTANPTSDTICIGATATLTLTGFGGPLQWQSWDGVSWVNETGPGNNSTPYSVSPAATTDYRAMFCGAVVSNTITIIVVNPVPPTTTGDTRCGFGTVNLSASGIGNMVWYNQPTGGSPLFTGNNYSPTVAATDTFYVESTIGSANPPPLTTTFAAGNGQLGNMFNITALQSVTITHFDGHMATGTTDWSVWYRPGTFIGFETDSTQWIFLGTAVGVVAQGTGNPTPIPITFNVAIPAGQKYGFYVTAHSGTVSYTNGAPNTLDSVFVQDANIQVRTGKGNAYFGASFSPRVWNGKVYYTSGCASATRTPVIATVNIADSVVVTASQTSICGLPASATVTLNASSLNASYNYTWVGADLNQNTGPSVTATPNATTTYIVTGDDGTCADTAAITIILTPPPPAAATANPVSICLGQPSQLSTPPGQVTYTVNSIPYAPLTFAGAEGPAGDDVLMPLNPQPGMPIGFTFNFFGTDYTAFKICTNGNIQFGPTFSTTFTPATIPSVGGLDNYIGVPWCDMFVDTAMGQHIKWATLGAAPNRMLVVSYDSVRAFFGGGFYKSQVILYEGTNCVEIHSAFATNTTANKVIGIENQTGTVGTAAPGRNNLNFNFNTPEAWAFCPVFPYTFVWTPATWLSSSTVFNPALTPLSTGNFTYTVTITNITSGCTSTSSVTVSVVAVPSAPTSSNLTRCGTGTVTLTATAGGPGTLQWWDAPVGGNQIGTGSPITSPIISFTDTFYVEEFDGNCPGPRTPVIVTVTPADTIIATPTSNPMCAGNPVTITIASINPGYSYSWAPAIGLSSTTGSSVTAGPPFTTLYTINAIDGAGCQTSTSINLVVNPSPVIAATANPVAVCAGTPSQLDINNTSQPLLFTVGTGTNVNSTVSYPAPFGNFWTGDRNQQLYLASELTAAGISAGPIMSVGYDITIVNTPALGTYTNFTVSVGATAQTFMTNTFVTGLSQVYYAASLMPVVGWNTLTFSTPFIWDGVSNIVVETTFMQCATCPGTPCVNFTVNCIHNRTTTPFVSSIDAHADFNCGITTVATGITYSVRPNTQFGAPSDFDYLWTPNVYLSSDTIPNPVASPTTSTTYTVNVFDNYYNCSSTSSITINVNPLPVVALTPLNSICIDASPLLLTGGTPTGGIYTGPGVSNNIFYPTVAGVGTYTIVYTYTDNLGCAGIDSSTITVNDLPVVTLPTFPTVCLNATPLNLTTGMPAGGSYSGSGVSAGMFDPNVAGTGIHGITYTYTDANGCTNSALRNIVVHDSPVANAGADVNGNTTLIGSASGGTPPYTYVWSPCLDLLNCNSATPFANPQVNTFYVLYVVDANGCYSTDTVLVTSTIGIAPIPVQNSGLVVYPNPSADGLFNVLFLKPNAQAEVTIVNSIGQEIYISGTFTAPALPYQVNLASQPAGIYVMQVKYRDRIITSRLVLNK